MRSFAALLLLTSCAGPHAAACGAIGGSGGAGGTDELGLRMVVGGVELELVAAYDARHATASTWVAHGAGPTLSLTGTGDAPTLDGASVGPFKSVTFPDDVGEGKYFASSEVGGQVGTRDFAVEILATKPTAPGGTSTAIFGATGNTVPQGWDIAFRAATNVFYFHADATDGTCASPLSADTTALEELLVHAFFDRSGNVRGYTSGGSAVTASLASCKGSLDNPGQRVMINAFDTSGTPRIQSGSAELAFVRVWQCPDGNTACFGDTAAQDTVARERFSQLGGT